jgi:pimeloyl-ACP methyl ester carboxylesterase
MLVGDKLSQSWSNRRAERFFALTNKNAVLSYMNEWSTQNFFDRTKEISTPFLVIYGEDDLEVWREKGQRQAFQYFKNVSFKAVANAGHYPMQQVPAYTVNLIESFILNN